MKKLLVAFFIFPFIFLLPTFVSAQSANGGNIIGYAWSPNVGWISFNCANDSSCGTMNYGVNMNGDGTLVGYAWSSNIGWIEFGNLSGFPSGSGTYSGNAKFVGNSLEGWARATAADDNGWDGWISLSGTNYGVTLFGDNFVGYGWDSGAIGWLSFNCSNDNDCGTSNYGVSLSGTANIDAQSPLGTSLSNNNNVPYATAPTIIWNINNISSPSCSVSETSGNTPFTTITNITASGSTSAPGLTTGAYVFNITCMSGGNTVASSNVSFTVAAQPPGFSLGQNDTIKISFLPAGWSQSETKTVQVNSVGGFTGNVSIGVSQYPTMPNASTTAMYSINGGAWTNNPYILIPITAPTYSNSFTFRVELNEPLTTAYCSENSNPCNIIFTGTASDVLPASKTLTITPATFNPLFKEQ